LFLPLYRRSGERLAVHPDRLAELQRQRELVREHLAWLDREIAGAAPVISGEKAPTQTPVKPTTPTPAHANGPMPSSLSPFSAPAVPDPIGSAADAKRGCLIFAAIAFFLGALALVAIYFLRYNGRPLL
jgi:hypothetical protein